MELHTGSLDVSHPTIHSGSFEKHPKGTQAHILLSSVFGPYAQDDEFGSRSVNPMELYHNQVTRAQGSFSLRMFHRSWGIMMIQANISAPCAVLDFPHEFRQESSFVGRLLPALLGPVLLWTTRHEERRLARGKTYEPPTILERRNWVEA